MLVPTPDLFTHRSDLHGQAHVARVMVHAMRLVEATGRGHLRSRVWAAVFLHDLARTHDGACLWHGMDAVRKWRESQQLRRLLLERGFDWHREPGIHLAVTVHCQPPSLEPSPDHPHYDLVALLKDADALDRVRLGDLDPTLLRFAEARPMVDFAQELFDATDGRIPMGEQHFDLLRAEAERISGEGIVLP